MERKIRVIIADDSEQTRENIHAIFGYEESIDIIGEAQNGLEAVALARELRPDVILMDINMPEMDGIKATQTITEEGFDGSIIIMSIQGEKEYIKKAMSAGARDYVIKPFGVNELIEGIRRVYQVDCKSYFWHQASIKGYQCIFHQGRSRQNDYRYESSCGNCSYFRQEGSAFGP